MLALIVLGIALSLFKRMRAMRDSEVQSVRDADATPDADVANPTESSGTS
ncbi:MAG: hypothetical protein ACPGUV_06575 [Polyangiales bacterium]